MMGVLNTKGIIFLICTIYVLLRNVISKTHSVETSAGNVLGVVSELTLDGKMYKVQKYLGIPYAEPPLGHMRLRKPLQIRPDFINATEMREICIQTRSELLPSAIFKESENCLYLNMYVPTIKSKERKSVLVWIHGGYGGTHFMNGAANFASGDVLSAFTGAIVVTFNYRLSLLGFFSADDGNTNGNYGLWDQQLAIKWVHENVDSFGGDPNKVTLLGEGQGAISAILQSLHVENKGLFQRIIAYNGTPFGVLNNALSPILTETRSGVKIAKTFGCFTGNTNETADCIRNLDVTLLQPILNYGQFDSHLFIPVIDYDFIMDRPDTMVEQYPTGNDETGNVEDGLFSTVDLMIGFNNIHDSGQTRHVKPDKIKKDFKKLINTIVKTIFDNRAPVNILRKVIINRYTDMHIPDNVSKVIENTMRLRNDVMVSIPAIRTALQHANINTADTETFVFFDNDISDSTNNLKKIKAGEITNIPTDVDFLMHLFGFSKQMLDANGLSTYRPTRSNMESSKQIMRLCSNFAIYGNPFSESMNTGDKLRFSYTEVRPETSHTLTSNPSVSFWLEIIPHVLSQRTHEVMLADPSVKKDDAISRNTDITKDGANAVIITLAAIVGGLCLALIALGVFVFTLKMKQSKLKRSRK